MSKKMQKYIPAVRPAVAIPIALLAMVVWVVALTAAPNPWMYHALFLAFCCVLVSSTNKYQKQLALQSSNVKKVEPPTQLSADNSLAVKWACRVWHEVTTMRKPLELNWNQIYEMESKLGKPEWVRLTLKLFRKEFVREDDDVAIDVSNSNIYPVSHSHAVKLRRDEALSWRNDNCRGYRAFLEKFGKGFAEEIANDSDIIGAHAWATEYRNVIDTPDLDEVHNRVADRVQKIIDEHRSTRREGARAYRDAIFKEE